MPGVIEWCFELNVYFYGKQHQLWLESKCTTINSSDFTNGFYLKTHRSLSKYSCPIFRQDLFCLKIHIIAQEQLPPALRRCLMPRAGPALLRLLLSCSCHPGATGSCCTLISPLWDLNLIILLKRILMLFMHLHPEAFPSLWPCLVSLHFLHCCLVFHPTQQSPATDGSTSKTELNAFHLKC